MDHWEQINSSNNLRELDMDVKFNRENDKSANFMTLLSCG